MRRNVVTFCTQTLARPLFQPPVTYFICRTRCFVQVCKCFVQTGTHIFQDGQICTRIGTAARPEIFVFPTGLWVDAALWDVAMEKLVMLTETPNSYYTPTQPCLQISTADEMPLEICSHPVPPCCNDPLRDPIPHGEPRVRKHKMTHVIAY